MKTVGHHGTTRAVAEQIVAGGYQFTYRENDGHWLGNGIYFFDSAPLRARTWAKFKLETQAPIAVVEVDIDLSDCLDLFDVKDFERLRRAELDFRQFEREIGFSGVKQPGLEVSGGKVWTTASSQTNPRLRPEIQNYRDRAVLDWFIARGPLMGYEIRSVRASFIDGDALFPESFLFSWAHAQLMVRDTNMISHPRIVYSD